MRGISVLAGIAVLAIPATGAEAAVTISNNTTANMVCSGGVCAPTATDAVLNTSDLESLLASGAVTVTTTGSGVQAGNIVVQDAVTWTSTNALTLDAYKSIIVDSKLSVNGAGGLSVATNNGGTNGTLRFGRKGQVVFSNPAGALAINGESFTLVWDIKTLAGDIADDPSGNFAFASDYDASGDGNYQQPPIRTLFNGKLEGLGNTILNFNFHGGKTVGLFLEIASGEVDDFGMQDAIVTSTGTVAVGPYGVLAAINDGTIRRSFATGVVTLENVNDYGFVAGGLVGVNRGIIEDCYTTGSLRGAKSGSAAGGIAGVNEGEIDGCFSSVQIRGAEKFYGGGLVGENYSLAMVINSYATGGVTGRGATSIGGLVGGSGGDRIEHSYSTGKVNGAGYIGGFAGYSSGSTYHRNYWDTTTSGSDEGVGNGEASGVEGRTTQQLQAGLPKGFSPKVWAENPKINGGLPYLIDNPPPE